MIEIHLTILGPPVPKARARTMRTKAGKSFSYTPQPTAAAEATVRAAFLQSGQEPIPRGLPLQIEMVFWLDRPPSAPKKRQHPTVRPDLDNLFKLVKDALQGLAFHDDCEVVAATLEKCYTAYPDPARTEVWIRTL